MNTHSRKNASSVKSQAGFTLIEIMVVVVILAILATFVLPNILSRPDTARKTKAQQDLSTIRSALQLYKLDCLNYPTTEQGIQELVSPSCENSPEDGYLGGLPQDAWGNAYTYVRPGSDKPFDLCSLGADGAIGGEGTDADICL